MADRPRARFGSAARIKPFLTFVSIGSWSFVRLTTSRNYLPGAKGGAHWIIIDGWIVKAQSAGHFVPKNASERPAVTSQRTVTNIS